MHNKKVCMFFTAYTEFGRELEHDRTDFYNEFRLLVKGFKYLGAEV